MTLAELLWFVGQINAQRWRFHYGRMATKGRLDTVRVQPPPLDLEPIGNLAARVRRFRGGLAHLAGGADDSGIFMALEEWRNARGDRPRRTA